MVNKFPYHSILIVCSVNTARSRMAEGFLKDFFTKLKLEAEVNSGGISSNARDGMTISMDAKLVMEEVGIKSASGKERIIHCRHWANTWGLEYIRFIFFVERPSRA